jgi:TPR repeat protein
VSAVVACELVSPRRCPIVLRGIRAQLLLGSLALVLPGCESEPAKPAPARPTAPPAPPAAAATRAEPAPEEAIVIKGSKSRAEPAASGDKPVERANQARIDELTARAQKKPTAANAAEAGPGCAPTESRLARFRPLLGALRERRFPELERELAALETAPPLYGTITSRFDYIVTCLAEVKTILPLLDDWCEKSPRSYLPFLLRGKFLIQAAWDARGSGWASTVTPKGWKLFEERLARAKGDLEHSYGLRKNPEASASLITVAMGLSLPGDSYFKDALAADPDNVSAYLSRFEGLKPRWSGSNEAMFNFARESAAARPERVWLSFLIVQAHYDYADYVAKTQAYLDTPSVRDEIVPICKKILESHPRFFAAIDTLAGYERRAGNVEAEKKLLKQLEPMDDPDRKCGLALRYYFGHGVPKDLAEAARWFEMAAREGSAAAQLHLGRAYVGGQGVAVNPAEAVHWYREAAEVDYPAGLDAMGMVYSSGYGGVASDLPKAFSLFLRAAEAGDANSQYEVAVFYSNGIMEGLNGRVLLEKNPEEARRWFTEAAENGNERARAALAGK